MHRAVIVLELKGAAKMLLQKAHQLEQSDIRIAQLNVDLFRVDLGLMCAVVIVVDLDRIDQLKEVLALR